MGNNKKLTTTLVILVVLGLVFMLLSGYATIFTALTMYVFASICIVLTVTTSKSKKQYSRRVDGWDDFFNESENKEVKAQLKSYKMRMIMYIFMNIVLVWVGTSALMQ